MPSQHSSILNSNQPTMLLPFFATAPKGVASVLSTELANLGATQIKEQPAGALFHGTLETAYRVCLWSRTAGRVLYPLADFYAPTPEALYKGIYDIDWAEHMRPDDTLCVDFNTALSKITHSHFGALKVKDGIVDFFRDLCEVRPSIDTNRPDLRINVHLHRDQATVSIDLSGDSLHRRGYRSQDKVKAPLKENLAAAILLRADWPLIAQQQGTLLDPMCGSGTFLIEAAMMAADIAPGLEPNDESALRHWGFLGWKNHNADIWGSLVNEAKQRRTLGLKNPSLPHFIGYDADRYAIRASLINIETAGLQSLIQVECQEIAQLSLPKASKAGLIVVNPPYGERLGDEDVLKELYRHFGETLKQSFVGWQLALLTGNPELSQRIGLRAQKIHPFFNGPIACKLLRFSIQEDFFRASALDNRREKTRAPNPVKPNPLIPDIAPENWSSGAAMFANRLKKNAKALSRWVKQESIQAYRLYDADMPEYALAIDLFFAEDNADKINGWAHVQAYEAPKTIDAAKAERRLQEALSVLPITLGLPSYRIVLKTRRRQKGKAQYETIATDKHFITIKENSARFLVNLNDYLDTGLFLDHRLTRQLIADLALGKRMLNLFAYTGTATVYAAKGGAKATTTIDMSKTYLQWAKKNMALNGFSDSDHYYIQGDCLQWLDNEVTTNYRYGLIFLDPPTFSSSKRMGKSFDIQRDHVALIQQAAKLLTPNGTLIFSNNFRKFKMDEADLSSLTVQSLAHETLPKDFLRHPKIHNVWKITLQQSSSSTKNTKHTSKHSPWKKIAQRNDAPQLNKNNPWNRA